VEAPPPHYVTPGDYVTSGMETKETLVSKAHQSRHIRHSRRPPSDSGDEVTPLLGLTTSRVRDDVVTTPGSLRSDVVWRSLGGTPVTPVTSSPTSRMGVVLILLKKNFDTITRLGILTRFVK
jgi:hypothetical protein